MIKTDLSSRFKNTEVIRHDGNETFGKWTRPDFLKQENVPANHTVTFTVTSVFAGRPDLIAQNFYGDDRLEWIVIMFNNPMETIGWPKAGTVIRIPDRSIVYSNI